MTEKPTTPEKVRTYLKRAEASKDLDYFPLEQEGLYEIIGGTRDEWGKRGSKGVYEGRFIDAVVKLASMKGMGGWYISADDLSNSSAGYVAAYLPEHIEKLQRVKGIAEYVTNMNQLEQEKFSLEERVKSIGRQMEGYA